MRRYVYTGSIVILGLLLSYLGFVHYTETGKAAIMRNVFTGELRLDHPGWNLSPPWVEAAHIQLQPQRICITTAGRGYSCKLVRFNAEYFREFVQVEGFHYYWWANRFSFNSGYEEEYRGFRDYLRGHGYGAKAYPFITILETFENE